MIYEIIVTTESGVDFYDEESFKFTSRYIRDQAFIGSFERFRQWKKSINLQIIENGFSFEWERDGELYKITYMKVDRPDEEVDISKIEL